MPRSPDRRHDRAILAPPPPPWCRRVLRATHRALVAPPRRLVAAAQILEQAPPAELLPQPRDPGGGLAPRRLVAHMRLTHDSRATHMRQTDMATHMRHTCDTRLTCDTHGDSHGDSRAPQHATHMRHTCDTRLTHMKNRLELFELSFHGRSVARLKLGVS